MKVEEPEAIVREIAEETGTDEQTVSQLYSEAMHAYEEDARVHDYVSLFAAKRVKEVLRATPHRRT
jgi:predicted transcriptional regulator